MFAQQLRQIGFGVLLEFTDPCTYVFERLLQNRVLVGEAEVFKGLVDSGKLFEHAVEAFDTFACRPGTVLQHQFLRGLYDQVGGIEQALECAPGVDQRGTVSFFQADVASQRNLERLEIVNTESGQFCPVGTGHFSSISTESTQVMEPRLGKLYFADHTLGQVDHFPVGCRITGPACRFLGIEQRQGFPQGLRKRCIVLIEPRLVEEQLSAEHLDHGGSVVGHRFEQVQRLQLLDRGGVFLGTALELLEELRLRGRQCFVTD
ncbi:hypothetical protein D9M69_476160 [compost metagenome]